MKKKLTTFLLCLMIGNTAYPITWPLSPATFDYNQIIKQLRSPWDSFSNRFTRKQIALGGLAAATLITLAAISLYRRANRPAAPLSGSPYPYFDGFIAEYTHETNRVKKELMYLLFACALRKEFVDRALRARRIEFQNTAYRNLQDDFASLLPLYQKLYPQRNRQAFDTQVQHIANELTNWRNGPGHFSAEWLPADSPFRNIIYLINLNLASAYALANMRPQGTFEEDLAQTKSAIKDIAGFGVVLQEKPHIKLQINALNRLLERDSYEKEKFIAETVELDVPLSDKFLADLTRTVDTLIQQGSGASSSSAAPASADSTYLAGRQAEIKRLDEKSISSYILTMIPDLLRKKADTRITNKQEFQLAEQTYNRAKQLYLTLNPKGRNRLAALEKIAIAGLPSAQNKLSENREDVSAAALNEELNILERQLAGLSPSQPHVSKKRRIARITP